MIGRYCHLPTHYRQKILKMALRLCLRQTVQCYQSPGKLLPSYPVRTLFQVYDKKAGIKRNPLTNVEVSKEEFKYAEKLLPKFTAPEPPKHDKYPTPSGWVPPSEKGLTHPYFVERTRFHNIPVYHRHTDGGSRKLTVINRVKGDHWKFEADLRDFLSRRTDEKVYTQVDELTEKVVVRGIFLKEVTEFLLEKGF